MRLLTIILFCFTTAFFSAKKSENLNGVWIPVKQEMNGAELPKAAFEKQRLVISDTTYTFYAESTDKGVAKFGYGKLDIWGKEGVNTGKHFMAIYKYENEMLTICYNLAGNAYPDSFDTKGKPAYFASTFVKQPL
jgi:uncharacterized protein (TIGR03067 family)